MAEDEKPAKPPAAKIVLPKRPPAPQGPQSFGGKPLKSFAGGAPAQRPPKRSPRGR